MMKRVTRRAAIIGVMLLGMLGILLPVAMASAESYSARVVADVLNVRAEPAAGAKIVGSLSYGTTVAVSDEAYGWLKIQAGKQSGWVAGQYLKKADGSASKSGGSSPVVAASASASASGGKTGAVTADTLWMREGPGTDSEAIDLLTKGTRLAIVKSDSGWLQVKTPAGKTGWVSARYVDQSGGGVSVLEPVQGTSKGGLKGKLIVVDPGHGGDDPGVIGGTYKTEEKTVNLQTALYVAEELRRAGARVVMTRTGDQGPELAERAAASTKQRADAFVSIHFNASPKKVSGTLSYYYSESKDRPLARSIEARLAKGTTGLKSNGISFGDFHVLRENSRPAVLLELGFLSDPGDEALARKADYQRKAAQAIAAGIADYFK